MNIHESEKLPVAPKITCHIIDSFILTFVKNGNVEKIILIDFTCISGALMLTTLHNIT